MDDSVGGEEYRSCPECGHDCDPEPVEVDGQLRVTFVCPLHGLHTCIDPFEGLR